VAPITRTTHALAIPQEKSFEVVANIYGESAVLQLADVRQMTAAVEDIVTAGTVTWPGTMSNVAEGGAKPTFSGTLASLQLVAQKMATALIVTEELLAESAIDIVSFYQELITQRMAQLIDVHALTGGGPFGTENLGAAATAAAGAHIQVITGTMAAPTAQHLSFSKAIGAIESDDFQPNGILSQRSMKGDLRVLADSQQRPLYVESLTADTPDLLYGQPVYYLGRGAFPTAAASTLRAIVGDFSQYIIGIRDELTFSLHNEGTIDGVNLLETNQVALRAEMRLGAKIVDNKAFSRVNNPAT
jgi:HK97 family phage major capsid protein